MAATRTIESILHTPVCGMFGIEVPIFLAGMGGAAGPELAAAVTNAGGLGVLGGTGRTPGEIRDWIRQLRELTDGPFGVDLILPAQMSHETVTWQDLMDRIPEPHQKYSDELRAKFDIGGELHDEAARELAKRPALGTGIDEQVEVILEEKVPVFVSGLGSPGFMIERAHAQGMKVMSIVGNVRAAKKVLADKVDVIVAQGYDGGGHTGRIGTFSLVPQVVDAVSPLPVLAAGGVSDGRGLAAALAFGCQGVWVGTRFLATEEANIFEWKKEAIVAANDTATEISKSYTGKPCRVMRNDWTDAWNNAPVKPLPMPMQPALARPILEAAPDNIDIQSSPVGQGSGIIKDIRPAAEVVKMIVDEAIEVLGSLR